eukprot:1138051-Pelagomonas_calceolata.AAC.1
MTDGFQQSLAVRCNDSWLLYVNLERMFQPRLQPAELSTASSSQMQILMTSSLQSLKEGCNLQLCLITSVLIMQRDVTSQTRTLHPSVCTGFKLDGKFKTFSHAHIHYVSWMINCQWGARMVCKPHACTTKGVGAMDYYDSTHREAAAKTPLPALSSSCGRCCCCCCCCCCCNPMSWASASAPPSSSSPQLRLPECEMRSSV